MGRIMRLELARLSLLRMYYRRAVPFWYPNERYHAGEILWCKETRSYVRLLQDYASPQPPSPPVCENLEIAEDTKP
jgi:hypothetical protein